MEYTQETLAKIQEAVPKQVVHLGPEVFEGTFSYVDELLKVNTRGRTLRPETSSAPFAE